MPGALLFGLPSTGKTLLARAVARESRANMISLTNPSYLAEYETLILPAIQISIEPGWTLDALFGSRTHAGQQSMIAEFIQEMDRLMASKLAVISATNRLFDLDGAVPRRPPCRVLIDLPDKAAREDVEEYLSFIWPWVESGDIDLSCVAAAAHHMGVASGSGLLYDGG
ncbi:hypothetical protein BDV93DRAFT_500989 [Ceratobasidium sp. AG-I]|nr:hypothetical protein BDV93DRAFT_500989 [Ceratobasidium sp. AG-I]